jgi:hypothetical protein
MFAFERVECGTAIERQCRPAAKLAWYVRSSAMSTTSGFGAPSAARFPLDSGGASRRTARAVTVAKAIVHPSATQPTKALA